MKQRIILPGIVGILIGLLLPAILSAQRGNIIIPIGSSMTVPLNAQICADTIFANHTGHGTLTLADPTCVCAGTIVIPVELLMFSATMQNGVTLLTWLTATEMHNYGFEVQRKTEADNWTTLGFVPGHGSTAQRQSYRYTDDIRDLPAYCSHLTYRLKQIDFDGRSEYSPEVEVRLDQPLPHLVLGGYPSPCDEKLTVRFTIQNAGATRVELYDITGRVVLVIMQDAVLSAGSHSVRARTAKVPSGLYLLEVETREGRWTEKVMIQH